MKRIPIELENKLRRICIKRGYNTIDEFILEAIHEKIDYIELLELPEISEGED